MSTRYTLTELAALPVEARFTTGDTVTISVYDSVTGLAVDLDSSACTEIETTGFFSWSFSNLTAQPTTFGRYVWIMSNGVIQQSDYVVFGGYVEFVAGALPAAETCKVYFNCFEPDGTCSIEPNRLYSETLEATAKIIGTNYQSSRYFTIEAVKPSYDTLSGQAFWILPQGATVKFKIDQINVEGSGIVPVADTVDLYTLLNP